MTYKPFKFRSMFKKGGEVTVK